MKGFWKDLRVNKLNWHAFFGKTRTALSVQEKITAVGSLFFVRILVFFICNTWNQKTLPRLVTCIFFFCLGGRLWFRHGALTSC